MTSGGGATARIREYLDHLAVEKGASAHTLAAYRRDLDRYSRHLAAVGVDDLTAVTETHVEDFRARLATGDPDEGRPPLAPSSVARTLAAVRGLHRFATRDGVTDTDVAAAVAGTGIIHLFEDWLRPYLDSGALEPVLEPWWQVFSGPFLYYPGRRHLPAPLRAFVDFVGAQGSGARTRG